MKKYIYLLFILSASLLILPLQTLAQADQEPDPQPCAYTYNECVRIGYLSVTPAINQGGGPQNDQLDVELYFQDICDIVSKITVTPTQDQDRTIPDSEISEVVNTYPFQVNANSFKDGILKITIWLDNGEKFMVDLWYDETFDCGEIIPLPVELVSFTGKPTQSGINLNWETASELNNSHFDIEKSSNGKEYSSIARIKGQGSTSAFTKYKFTDINPGEGTNYYRLKQVDFDNTAAYSKTIAVRWQAGEAIQVALAPNPCRNGDCNLTVANTQGQETLIELKDMAGRVVYTTKVKSDRYLLELPMSDLTHLKGLYFLTATSGMQVVNQRIVLE